VRQYAEHTAEHEFEQSASFAERHVFGTISMKRIGAPSTGPKQAADDFTDRNQAVSFTLHGFAAE
jgi:hypothetical protein